MRLLLIDAYAMIYRAYYAFVQNPRLTSDGRNTSAIFGFLLTLEELIKKAMPTHIGVAFDPKGKTFRHEMYEQYKAQRPDTPEDIHTSVPVIKDILQAMNITVLEVAGFEADDVIGTLAKKAEAEGFAVLMATPDKDYGQLVTEHINMFRPRHSGGFEQMGPKEVCDKYGLSSTEQVIDLLALMGDSSDNIPGCKGVGEKTTVRLLQEFGNIDNLLSSTDQLKGSLKTKIETQIGQIRFSRLLATIRTDVPIDFNAKQLLRREPNTEKLIPIYQDLEFRSLITKLKTTPTKNSVPDLFSEPEPEQESNQPIYDTTQNRIISYLLNPEISFNPYIPPREDLLKQNNKLWWLYQNVELPLTEVLDKMSSAGVRFDLNLLKTAEQQLSAELNNLGHQIYQLAGTEFNINSPKQVGELLFDTLKITEKVKKTKSGQYITSEDVMQELTDKHPIVEQILEYRELKKLISTYISPLPNYIDPKDGKIHAIYNQTVTATGRLSCSNPNLQNLPIRSQRGKLIRQAVIPDQGCVFFSADYSQIELRLMAHFSGDEHLIQAFLNGEDIHTATAAKIFSCPISEVTPDMRRKAKTANFGIIYGISAFGLGQQLQSSRTEAKELIDGYFVSFPKIAQFIEQQKDFARSHGYVETLFGRRRYLPDINSRNPNVRAFAERNAVNAPIQGTAADIIKIAMVNIYKLLQQNNLKTQMIMQVHDELNFNVPKEELNTVTKIIVSSMQNIVPPQAPLSVPLIASYGSGKNWLLAH